MSGEFLDDEKEIDVSVNLFCWVLACPCSFGAIPYRETLLLSQEEVTLRETSLCGESVTKYPYSELGSVNRNTCLCWTSATSKIGSFSPGCGCNQHAVRDIAEELRGRVRQRGEEAQLRRTEEALDRLKSLESKVDLIMERLANNNIPNSMKMEDRFPLT